MDDSSTMLPIFVAIAAVVPFLFCLCKLWCDNKMIGCHHLLKFLSKVDGRKNDYVSLVQHFGPISLHLFTHPPEHSYLFSLHLLFCSTILWCTVCFLLKCKFLFGEYGLIFLPCVFCCGGIFEWLEKHCKSCDKIFICQYIFFYYIYKCQPSITRTKQNVFYRMSHIATKTFPRSSFYHFSWQEITLLFILTFLVHPWAATLPLLWSTEQIKYIRLSSFFDWLNLLLFDCRPFRLSGCILSLIRKTDRHLPNPCRATQPFLDYLPPVILNAVKCN